MERTEVNHNFFQQFCYVRQGSDKQQDHLIDRRDWLWPLNEEGCWTGPRENWIDDHEHKWFKYCRSFDLVVQAGGAMGVYPYLLSRKFEAVITFEPTPISFYCLNYNCQIPNIIKFNAALGDVPKLIDLACNPWNLGSNRIVKDKIGIIPQMALDALQLPKCDLLALDVEGYEAEALKGAIWTIKTHLPTVIIEDVYNTKAVEVLNELGYVVKDRSGFDTIFVHSSHF